MRCASGGVTAVLRMLLVMASGRHLEWNLSALWITVVLS